MSRRVFLVVLDSFGIGNAPDSADFGDLGSNTLAAVCKAATDEGVDFPNLKRLGLFDIEGHEDERILPFVDKANKPIGAFGRLKEISKGKDTTIGHFELAGLYLTKPLPTYPDGFPQEILDKLSEATGREILCNKPYSGTKVIADYGAKHMETGALIVYTSADSVLQIAAHEEVVPLEELYDCCEKARAIMVGEHAVGRVIARPFVGSEGNFTRTANRHDYSVIPPSSTMLDVLKVDGFDVIGIGKITDIYANQGLTKVIRTSGNQDGIRVFKEQLSEDFNGLCFINLVDFDMLYGHRNDSIGYMNAIKEFDNALDDILPKLCEDDLLIITADHGCDPSTESTDHSREMVPLLIYGDSTIVNPGSNLGTIAGFADVSTIVLDALLAPTNKQKFSPEVDTNKPDENNIWSYVDLTNLKKNATTEDISKLVETAVSRGCASCCVQPIFVRDAVKYAKGRIAICTVIGFPNGYHTTASKNFETIDAIRNGASEIDMVININMLKQGDDDYVLREIATLRNTCHQMGAILKVIVETSRLSEDEKIRICKIVSEAKADFIKTSTGFDTHGATIEDVRLMKANVSSNVRIKAAGGIRSTKDARQMIEAGAIRIGASNLS